MFERLIPKAPVFLFFIFLKHWFQLYKQKSEIQTKTCYKGTAQILLFDTFSNLIKSKYDQTLIPIVNSKLQILTSNKAIFDFKIHTTNPQKYNIEENTCLSELATMFQTIVNKETSILYMAFELQKLMSIQKPSQTKRSLLDIFGPSTSEIRTKGNFIFFRKFKILIMSYNLPPLLKPP